jgi:DNA-binding response OmpR family regulator
MASASHAALCRLVLQRSDRHPIACIDGDDLAKFNSQTVRWFIDRGLLTERELLVEAGQISFQMTGDQIAAFSLDGDEETRLVATLTLRQFDLDLHAICKQIRIANKLEGRKVEIINPKVVWLGALGKGSRRREFYFVRALHTRSATDTALSIRGRASAASLVILTPTERNLSNDILKRLAAEGISIVSISEMLEDETAEPFSLSLPSSIAATRAPRTQERLTIDDQGVRAVFDGRDVDLRPREFHVLKLLAIETTGQNGFVSRAIISETIREVTGNQETNEEQVDKSINLIRDALAKAGRLNGNQRAKLIETKRKVGYRVTLPAEAVRIF